MFFICTLRTYKSNIRLELTYSVNVLVYSRLIQPVVVTLKCLSVFILNMLVSLQSFLHVGEVQLENCIALIKSNPAAARQMFKYASQTMSIDDTGNYVLSSFYHWHVKYVQMCVVFIFRFLCLSVCLFIWSSIYSALLLLTFCIEV